MEYNFKPIETWPQPPTKHRRRAPFKALYGKTLIDLERELRHLGAKDVVIQADCAWDDIRMDGRIRSSARMRGPGVIVSFNCKHGPLSYPCDSYDEWTGNLRAIALAMAALRAVDRYGVTRRGEQYRGWKQLPAGESGRDPIQASEWATLEDAARFILSVETKDRGGYTAEDVEMVLIDPDGSFKAAARLAHPDAGGSNETMAKLNRARDFIVKMRAEANGVAAGR